MDCCHHGLSLPRNGRGKRFLLLQDLYNVSSFALFYGVFSFQAPGIYVFAALSVCLLLASKAVLVASITAVEYLQALFRNWMILGMARRSTTFELHLAMGGYQAFNYCPLGLLEERGVFVVANVSFANQALVQHLSSQRDFGELLSSKIESISRNGRWTTTGRSFASTDKKLISSSRWVQPGHQGRGRGRKHQSLLSCFGSA